jgi:hypothetical protein
VHGRQQKSHCISPHGHEIHGFVEPLIGFLMLEATDDVDEGGILLNEQDVSRVKKRYLDVLGRLSRASDAYLRFWQDRTEQGKDWWDLSKIRELL